MNYEPNTHTWEIGDLVLHDADRKHTDMLMKVIGYTRDGLCRTKYINPFPLEHGFKRVYKNEIKCLHDPKRFGIEVAK